MQRSRNLLFLLPLLASTLHGQTGHMDYVQTAQRQIVDYLAALADLHCTEKVTQQKLDKNGHVSATERSQFDYLVMMMGSGDDFELNESRRELAGDHHKNLTQPMLITNGISTALLVFHPYYSNSFNFSVQPETMLAGHPAVPVHFEHIAGRRTPLALALRNREYPVEMSGTAWLDKSTGSILRIEAHLEHDMTDVGLKSMEITVDYKPTGAVKAHVSSFPSEAVIDVTTPRQHWRNTHLFENYRAFSAEAEQDPNVVVHNEKTAPSTEGANTSAPGKENQ